MNVAGARILVVGGVHRLGRRARPRPRRARRRRLRLVAGGRRRGRRARSRALLAAGAPLAAAVAGDVRWPTSAAGLVADAAAALGGLDGLVYAASGPFVPTPPEGVDEASWDASLDTIAKGFFFTARAPRASASSAGAGAGRRDRRRSPTTWACSRGPPSRRTAPPRRPRSTS